jgi:hypothetical protein
MTSNLGKLIVIIENFDMVHKMAKASSLEVRVSEQETITVTLENFKEVAKTLKERRKWDS